MKAVPDDAHVRSALESAEAAAFSLAKVELCHFLAEVRRILGEESPEQFLRAYFGLEDLAAPDRTIDPAGETGALQYMPLADAISEASLSKLPIYEGWRWWNLYARWNLFVGPNPPREQDKTRYRSIIGNRKVLEDAGVEDSDILVGTYRFQVDFDPDDEWIDEFALCLLCDVSEKTVAEVCAREDVETCKSEYHRSVIRVGAVREYLSTSPDFTPTTFLDPDDDRLRAATRKE